MRSLAQPEVLKSAGIAALISSLVCFPRLLLWSTRVYPLWYLEALLFLGGMVLWGFVFAWHTKYTQRPVFTLKWGSVPFGLATVSGLGAAIVLHLFVDPALRSKTPADYPVGFEQWLAMTLFTLAFTQLFLVFAPFAWLMRLCQGRALAMPLTVLFGAFVLVLRNHRSPVPLTPDLLLGLLIVRLGVGSLSVCFLLRGGVVLVWWWSLLIQSRHLLFP